MRIAIIGAGIAGNSAAYALSHAIPRPRLTLYERNPRTGGHSATAEIDYDGARIRVDTGFIVYNEANYPGLTAMFRHLGVATERSDMSFAVSSGSGRFEWSGGEKNPASSFFAQRRNIVSLSHWRLLRDILRFHCVARQDTARSGLGDITMGAYLDGHGFSPSLRTAYILPMGAAIWSMPQSAILDFPAATLLSFFANHGLLERKGHQWRTVTGGSREYVERLTAPFRSQTRLGATVITLRRSPAGVEVTDSTGTTETYDHAVLAVHAPQSLAMLADASVDERGVLGPIRTLPNAVYLHRDTTLMPRRKAAWASWNVLQEAGREDSQISVTYWMNRLQNLDPLRPLFVSLNPPRPPRPELTFATYSYDHPQFDAPALAARRRLDAIQGQRRTWFCGAWTGYGFHEDGLRSGLAVAAALGAAAPWEVGRPLATQAAE